MSFRDQQRRYGHVPPVQYPVAGQQQQQASQSFGNGEDHHNNFYDPNTGRGQAGGARSEDELFMGSPTEATPATSPRTTYNPGLGLGMSGYQHQYQPPPQQGQQAQSPPAHSTYNPQAFARSHSTSLPYRGYTSPTTPIYEQRSFQQQPPPPAQPPQQQQQVHQQTSYTPQTYNPAAYASTTTPSVPQRTSTYAGHTGYSQHSYSSPAVPQTSTFRQASHQVYSPSAHQTSFSQTPVYEQSYQQYGSAAPTPASQPTPSQASSYSSGSNNYFNQPYSPNGTSQSSTPATQSAAFQAPYPTHSQIPVGPNYSPADFAAHDSRISRSSSNASQGASPGHASSSPGLQRHPTHAPLPSRPMEGVPEEGTWDPTDWGRREEDTQDTLTQDILADLHISDNPNRSRQINGNVSDDDLDRLRRYDSTASTVHSTQYGPSGIDRNLSTASTVARNDHRAPYDFDDDSDPEGALGANMLREAELDDRRFTIGPSPGFSAYPETSAMPAAPAVAQLAPRPLPTAGDQSASDTEFGAVDLGAMGGGFAGSLTYGNDVVPPLPGKTGADETRLSHGYENGSQFPTANMDYGGTGGLHAPSRLSFDQGDERVDVNSRGSESPLPDDYPDMPDMFYHPGMSSRPLPPPPPESDSSSMLSLRPPSRPAYQHAQLLSADRSDIYATNQHVERSTSMSSHSNTPQIHVPGRSRTDAAEERKKALRQLTQQNQWGSQTGTLHEGYDPTATPAASQYDAITLPSGRRKKFNPSKFTAADIQRCTEPWALGGIATWVRDMAEGEVDLKKKTIEEGLVKLFVSKVPTMNVADAETLAAMVVDSMFAAGILVPEEEWVKFGSGSISGVLWQMTGSGCYAPKLHEHEEPDAILGRCYSHHCTRTLRKANLDELMSEEVNKQDWASYYQLTAAQAQEKPKKEIERQNNLHEIVTSEEEYNNQLEVLRVLYRDQLRAWQPPIIPPNRLEKFIDTVFGKVEPVQQTNKNNLLAQLKYRQNEQGPWVSGFSDIFREWIRKARDAYLQYSAAYNYANYTVRRESGRNMLFKQFLDHIRNHKSSNRLGWDTFLKAPITRLQRYGLLLTTVLKNTVQDSEEKVNLARAIEEIKQVTLECDKVVDDMQRKVELIELQTTLVLRPGFNCVLNLDHLGRQLLQQGDLQRMGSKGVRWVDTHALLFDHFFILAKEVVSKDGRNEKKYDVSREPIPMPLLFLESSNDDPVSKQKGLTAPLARTTAASSDTRLNKVASNSDRPDLVHTNTGSSYGSTAVTRVNTGGDDSKILYPFKVKHLGHEVYTLYASSPQVRKEWCDNIISAKMRHAKALHSQNAEPFRLRVLADGAFTYDNASAMGRMPGVSVKGTPLDRAIREIEQIFPSNNRPVAVCRATVNCATAFNAYGKLITAIGTDFGVYWSEASNPRGWTRSVQISRVTQIAVLEEFSVCLIVADKSLISYPLDVVAPVSNFPPPTHDSTRRAPQRLAKDVAFFATARMKDRMLVFYKRKEGLHTSFKILEPVFQKASEKKPRIFGSRKGGSGTTETFRDFDEFYFPTECYSLSLFHTYIAVSTAKGIEMLTLDRKQPMTIPHNLNLPAISNIAARIKDQRPLGMFRLNDQEFILAYEDCAVYADKHGEVSRTLIMEYSGKQKKARSATMFGQHLLLFTEDYVEVRNAENGRLRQIIAGRDVRCLDYGLRGPTGSGAQGGNASPAIGHGQAPVSTLQDSKGTVKICMSHPEQPGTQIVLEMLLNDGHNEKV